MKIALLGKGKTGSRIIELVNNEPGASLEVFDRAHPPERNALARHDIIISFLPGEAFLQYIPELMASGVPVVTGSTGFDWPGGREAFSDELSGKGLVWVHANNFSLGMSLIRQMIQILGMANLLYENCSYSMKEVHHAGKRDAPSGTALTWKQWLNQPVEIFPERTGDVTGEHTLILDASGERISIHHSALNRDPFASGALWAARMVLNGRMASQTDETVIRERLLNDTDSREDIEMPDDGGLLEPGLCDFQSLLHQRLKGALQKEGSSGKNE